MERSTLLSRYELKSRCDHIISYGSNWGFVHVRGEVQWREQWLRENKKKVKEMEIELEAYKSLIKNMEKIRNAQM